MKILVLSVIALLSFSSISAKDFLKPKQGNNDTTIIQHELDGNTSEWPASKFELDPSTNIKYAVDNDVNNLYVAMIVPDVNTQIKMIRLGMNLYLDIKGKRREDKGIEFPVVNQNTIASDLSGGYNQSINEVKSNNGMNLIFTNLFGFTDEPLKQGLLNDGSVSVQYSWDAANVMYIEYNIPLKLLSDNNLNQKTISLGWKINVVEVNSTSNATKITTTVVGRPSNASGRQTSSTTTKQVPQDNRMKQESFWTKYTVLTPAK